MADETPTNKPARYMPPNAGKGRVKGVPNKITRELHDFIDKVLTDPVYQDKLLKQAREGTMSETLQLYMWQLRAGKPREIIDLNLGKGVPEHLVDMDSKQLAEHAAQLAQEIAHEAAQEDFVDAELVHPIDPNKDPS